MANVNSVSSSSSASSLYGTRNVLSGLASGLDTESMIENSIKGYQTKISQLEQQQTKVEWKQDAYRTYIDSLNDFMKKYGSSTSKTDLSSASFFAAAQTTSVLGDNASKVTASGKTNSDIEIWSATKGTAARYVLSASALGAAAGTGVVSGGGLDWGKTTDETVTRTVAKYLAGKTITVDGHELTIPDLSDSSDHDNDLAADLQSQLSGTGITVAAGASGGLTFSRADGTGVSVSFGSGVAEDDGGSALMSGVTSKLETASALTWNADKSEYSREHTLAEYLKGKSIILTDSNNTEYTLTFPTLREGANADMDNGLVRDLQRQLNAKNANITVEMDSVTGVLSFTRTDGTTLEAVVAKPSDYLDKALNFLVPVTKTATSSTINLEGSTISQSLAERLAGSTLTVDGHQITLPDLENVSGDKTDALAADIQLQFNAHPGWKLNVSVVNGKLAFSRGDDTSVSVSFDAETGSAVRSGTTQSVHERSIDIDLNDKNVLSLANYLKDKTITVDGKELNIGNASNSSDLSTSLQTQLNAAAASNTTYSVTANSNNISFSKTVTTTTFEPTNKTFSGYTWTWHNDTFSWSREETDAYLTSHGTPEGYTLWDSSEKNWYKEVPTKNYYNGTWAPSGDHHPGYKWENFQWVNDNDPSNIIAYDPTVDGVPDTDYRWDAVAKKWYTEETTQEYYSGSYTPTRTGYTWDGTNGQWTRTMTTDYVSTRDGVPSVDGNACQWDANAKNWYVTTSPTATINDIGTGSTVTAAIGGNGSSTITLDWSKTDLPQDAFAYLKDNKSIDVDGTEIKFDNLSGNTSVDALKDYIQSRVSSLITVSVEGNSLKFSKKGGEVSTLGSNALGFGTVSDDRQVSAATTDISLDWTDTISSEQNVAEYLKNKTITIDGKSKKLYDITSADTANADSFAAYLGRKFSGVDVDVDDSGRLLFSKNGQSIAAQDMDLRAADTVFGNINVGVTTDSTASVTVPDWGLPVETKDLSEYLNGRTIVVGGTSITFEGFDRSYTDTDLKGFLDTKLAGTDITADIVSGRLTFARSDGQPVTADLSAISGAVGGVTTSSAFGLASGKTWTGNASASQSRTLASDLQGKTLEVSYGTGDAAASRTLTISGLDTNSTADQTQKLLDGLNAQLTGTGVKASVVAGEIRFTGATRVDDSAIRAVGVSASVNTDLDLSTKKMSEYSLNATSMSIGGKTITFTGDTTLSELFSKINSDTDISVSYSRITGEIVFAAKEAGAGRIEMDAAAMTLFGGAANADGTLGTAGTDSVIDATINGRDVTLTASSNQFSLDGLTVTLKDSFDTADDQDPLTFQTEADSDKIVSAVKSYVDDYNALVKSLYSAISTRPNTKSNGSSYEPLTDADKADMSESAVKAYEEKAKAGLLFGDSDLRGLFDGLRSAFAPTVSTTGMTAAEKSEAMEKVRKMQQAMTDIGLSTEYADGVTTLKIDEDKLRAALDKEGTDVVKDVFANSSGYKARDGLTGRIQAVMEKYADTSISNTGILVKMAGTTLSSTSLLSNTLLTQINKIQDQIDTWNSKMSAKIDYYTKQFSLLEQLMNQMNAQSSSLMGLLGG